MKKILYIFFLLISVARAQSVIDSTTLKIAPARDGLFYEISDPGTVPDNITHFVFGGKHYRKLGLSNEKTTENLGIYPNGTNYRARLQGLIDSSSITKISIASIMPGQITINGDSIDFRGKTLVFKGGVQLKGSTKIKNVLIDADKRDFIIDSTIVLGENVKFLNGEISVMNLGAGPTRTAAQNASIIRKATDYAGIYKGQTILFPEGDYKIRRKDTKIIEGQKYTTYKGEGMYKTRLILDSADYFNFRRIFDLGEGDSSVTIKDFGFKMGVRGQYYDSAGVDFTEDDGDPATDYQCMPIFSYSGDSTKPVFDLRIENIFAEDLPGDVIGISRNTQYVHIKNIRFRNYMRQGISLGGGGVKDVWIEDVIDLGSTTILQVGGHSIHCEPSSLQYNINYLNCKVRDFSYSGIASGSISGIETWGNSIIYCNKISNTVITDCKINGQLQISSLPEGNINVHNNRELLDGIYVTTVSGASSSPKSIYIQNNKKIIATGKPAIWLNNMDSLVLDGNDATNSGDVTVRIANCRGTRVVNNKIKKTGTGNYEALYLYSSSSSLFGVGMDYINNNIIDGDYRGIRIGNKSAIIGPSNVVNAPTPYEISTAKIFPYRGPDGKQYLKFLGSGLPTYKDWAVGDVVENTANTPGEQRFWICDTAGAAHQGNWNPSLTYYINAYVRDSTNGRVYRSKAVNGQNELPSSDTDNTYWEQVATRTASFVGSDAYKGELWGFGVPTRTDVSTGTIYHRRDGDSCTSIYTYSATGWKASGCGGGGISKDDVITILDSLPTDSLPTDLYKSGDSLIYILGGVRIAIYDPSGSAILTSTTVDTYSGTLRLSPDGNTIFDIMDVNTGEYFSVTKATAYNGVTLTDAMVDEVLVFKRSGFYYVRSFSGNIKASWYGVKYDGTTNSQAALTNIITNVYKVVKKSTIEFDKGVIRFEGDLNIPIGMNWKGAGQTATIFRKINNSTKVNGIAIRTSNPNSIALDTAIHLTNFGIDGNRDNQSVITADTGIVVRNSSTTGDLAVYIADVNVINTISQGLFFAGRLGGSKVFHVEALKNYIGFDTYASDMNFLMNASGQADSIGFRIMNNSNTISENKAWGGTCNIGFYVNGKRNNGSNNKVQEISQKGFVINGDINSFVNSEVDRMYDSTGSVAIEIGGRFNTFTGKVTNYIKQANGETTTNAYVVNNLGSKYNRVELEVQKSGARTFYNTGFTASDSGTVVYLKHETLGVNRFPNPLRSAIEVSQIPLDQRLIDTTYADIVDPRTKEVFAITKMSKWNNVTLNDTHVDSVLVFKIGSNYWVRNIVGDIPATSYNLIADGSTDNTAAFQKLANVANTFKKKIYFPAGAGVYKVTGKVTIDPSVFYSFAPGAIIAADSLIGGVPDIPYWQQAFTDTTVVRPSAIAGGMVSVKWWGAKGDNSNNDQPAIQSAVNCVTYNNTKFTTVFLPSGIYKIDDPIACARYNVNKWEQVTVTLLGEGSGFSSKFAGNGTIIRKTYKDRPGVWFQIAKSGGIQSITIEGAYTVPSMSDSAFYNISLSAYTDPTCRDTKFSPDCGVAIDPLKYTGTPADGGYPGQSGLGSTWNYSAAGNATSSGSSGISFKDMKVRKNVVGFIASPNGQTQNNDASTYENIKIEDSKVGFSSCQDQEKGNVYRNIISWGTCHTLFDNLTYGVGTSGHIIVEKVNVAALNNQLVNWSTAGRFPSFWRDIYSESLGRFGTLATTSSAITVRDAVLRWVDPALAGGYLPNYHIDVTRGVTFDGCSIMNYGLFLPTIIKSTGTGETGAVFANCYFETPPVFWAVHASGTPVFKDCYYYPSNKFNPLGSIQAQFAQTKTWTVNSTYKLTDNASSFTTKTAAIKEINVDGSYLWDATATGNNIAVSPNPDRTDTVTVSNGTAPFYIAGRPIYFLDGSVFLFGGIVSGQNGNNSVYIKNMPIQMVTKTYTRIYAMNYITLHGFLGNTTSGSQYIKGVSTSGDVGVAVGQVVHSKIFGGSAVVMYVSNDTVQLTNAANATTTGTYFTPRGVTRNFINPSTATDSATFGGSQIMGVGATFESTNQQKYLVTKSGFFSAVAVGGGETRQAEWVPFNQNYSIGSGAPSTSTGLIGDMYKDTTAGREYRKTAASTWTILPADPVSVKTLDGQSMNGPGDIDITVGKVPTGDSIKICIGGVCYTVKDSTAAYLGGGLPSYPYNYGVRTSPRGYDSTWMLVIDTVNHRIGIKGTPSYDLDVNGTFRKVGNNTARFEHSSGNNMHGIELYATGVGTAMAQWKANQSTGEVRFGAGSGGYFFTIFSNNTERARFFANGRFGYNMTTDLNVANFHINSSVAINKDSTVKQSSIGTRQMLVMDSTNGKIQRMDIPTLGTPITGTYTPSASSNTNVSSATFSSSNYVVNDKLVTVWGKVEVVLSNTANTSMLTFNLPSVGTLLTSSIRGVSNYRMGSCFLSESSGSVRIDFIKEGSPIWVDYIIEYSYSFYIQ